MFVKVCGIKNYHEIEWAVELGYSAIGIVVYKKSRRFVEFNRAIELLKFAKGKIKTVVVSVYKKDVLKFKDIADFIQCYELFDYNNLIFATDFEPAFNNYKYLLYDSSRGRGEFTEFPSWIKKYRKKLIIAGGLNYENVINVIEKIKPFGIDVSSGVESMEKKDYYLMRKFIEAIK